MPRTVGRWIALIMRDHRVSRAARPSRREPDWGPMALLVLSFILVASPVMAAPIVTISIPELEPDKPGVFATVTLTAPPSGVTIHLPDGNIGDPNGITISDQVSFTVTTLPIKITYTFTSGGDVPGGLGLCASGVGGCGLIESDAFQIFSTLQF